MGEDNRNSNDTSTSANANERMVLRVKSREKMKRLVAMSSRVDIEDGRRGRRSKKMKKKPIAKKSDPKMPKKPPTAFFFFLEDFRKEYQEQNPDVKTMRMYIGKACGEKWKTMTYEEKVQYYDIATEKRREFDQAMAEYIKRKERDGEEETEEDSEYDE